MTKQPLARFPRMLARAGPSTEDATKEDEQVTFKYNPAMQRWEKKKGGYKDGRKGNVESLITPLAGAAYTVRNSGAEKRSCTCMPAFGSRARKSIES